MNNDNKHVASSAKKILSKDPKSLLPVFSLKKTDWFLVPIGILTAFSLYDFVVFLLSSSYVATERPIATVLVFLFGAAYIYQVLKHRTINAYSRTIAYLFSFIVTASTLFMLSGAGLVCSGFFGVQASCSENNYFIIWLLLLNPYALMAWSALAASGITAIIVQSKKSRKSLR